MTRWFVLGNILMYDWLGSVQLNLDELRHGFQVNSVLTAPEVSPSQSRLMKFQVHCQQRVSLKAAED